MQRSGCVTLNFPSCRFRMGSSKAGRRDTDPVEAYKYTNIAANAPGLQSSSGYMVNGTMWTELVSFHFDFSESRLASTPCHTDGIACSVLRPRAGLWRYGDRCAGAPHDVTADCLHAALHSVSFIEMHPHCRIYHENLPRDQRHPEIYYAFLTHLVLLVAQKLDWFVMYYPVIQ